jgi:hypothetical protein
MPQIVSANRLSDGIIVFLGPSNQWVERLAEARVYADAAAAREGLAFADSELKGNRVVEIAAFDVSVANGVATPVHLRDKIRAAGPTVHREHGKQAG